MLKCLSANGVISVSVVPELQHASSRRSMQGRRTILRNLIPIPITWTVRFNGNDRRYICSCIFVYKNQFFSYTCEIIIARLKVITITSPGGFFQLLPIKLWLFLTTRVPKPRYSSPSPSSEVDQAIGIMIIMITQVQIHNRRDSIN